MLVISPHLDDAIFSCGALIEQTDEVTIATICAGVPGDEVAPSQFDAAAGFATAADAMRERRREDRLAAGHLGAAVIHMDCLEVLYDDPADHDRRIETACFAALDLVEAGPILAPLGIRHVDHVAVWRALRPIADIFYEELPYRVLWPDVVRPFGTLQAEQTCSEGKRRAIERYSSQLIGMDVDALYEAERYRTP